MSGNNQFSFPLSAVFLATAIGALFLARGLSFWFVLLVTVLIAIHVCVEVLTLGVPSKLRDLSRSNCHRMDGTLSHRRSDRERRALGKIRSDLWAIFLIVAFVAAVGLFVLQTVFPLNLVPDVGSAAWDAVVGDSGDFKLALKERGVDDQFFHSARDTSRSSNADIRQRQEVLWSTWPVILGVVLATFVGCLALVRFAYFRTLREFEVGVKARSAQYLDLDIGRLQG